MQMRKREEIYEHEGAGARDAKSRPNSTPTRPGQPASA